MDLAPTGFEERTGKRKERTWLDLWEASSLSGIFGNHQETWPLPWLCPPWAVTGPAWGEGKMTMPEGTPPPILFKMIVDRKTQSVPVSGMVPKDSAWLGYLIRSSHWFLWSEPVQL